MKKIFNKKKVQRFKFDLTALNPKNLKKKLTPKKILIGLGYFILAMLLLVGIMFAWFSKDLPTPGKIANRKPTVSTKIYDRTGQTLLYETGEQKRTVVQGDQISQYLKDATVSTEDANFYKHHGVDTIAIIKAVGEKLLGRTRVTRGGSTITQQYVKNALLTSDRSITRKIKEAMLSVELEFMYKKDEILTMYLNEIPYGNATAGAEAAAKAYYGKAAKDLTLAQAATLAAIPQAPTYYSPYGTHVDKLIGRRNYVLNQMVKNNKITQEQADEAKKEDTTTLGIALKARHDSILAPHFAMYVLEQIADKYGEEAIQKEGLSIITTLDYDKQKSAEEAITSGVPKLTKYNASNAALVAVDPKTGQILSMVGSKDYFDTSIDGNVNVADSLRQPGSSFKPFAYATAFKKPEYSPSKIIFDLTTDFGNYTPSNYNGRTSGPVTMRYALANSLNIPAVKVMALAGIDNVLRTASDLGITSLTQRDRYGLSLVLGAGEVTPVEMAGAYSVFATNGVKNDVTPILKITDSNNKVIYDFDKDHPAGKSVLDSQITYEISSILSDNNVRCPVFGCHSALYFQGRTVAAKTGTTSDFKDAWTVGYTPSLAVAVWVGNSDASKMKSGADGSVVAAPIFHSFVEKALSGTPAEEFTKPEGIQEVTVEKYSDKLPSQYSKDLATDIFASWQIPTEKDTIHKEITVCKGTSLLAPKDADSNLTEIKVITDIHSEMPDNANWENPVRAWAEANGMLSSAPTETCDLSNMTTNISITNPAENADIQGTVNIQAKVESALSISKVEFYVDGVSIGESINAPFAKDYNFSSLENGKHTIQAIATSSAGTTAKTTIDINVIQQVADNEILISGLNFTTTSTTATITWVTNRASNSVLSYYPDNSPHQKLTVTNNSLDTAHSIKITGLTRNQKYQFTVSSADADDNADTDSGIFTTQ